MPPKIMPDTIMLDASVLIDHFRTKNKADTFYTKIVRQYGLRFISAIAKMEILYGARAETVEYWNDVFSTMTVIPFTDDIVTKSHEIILDLKRKSLLLDMEDIMIAASAIVYNVPLATLNRKHFERIDGLKLVGNVF